MQFTNNIIDSVLETYIVQLGKDHERYRNHVYRVFSNCLLLDKDKHNEDKYAIAAVYHDIGIWTNHTFDYLDPSIDQASQYLNTTNQRQLTEEIAQMIYWHHKITAYKGNYMNTVETFRKADWIDVSLGLLSFGINKQQLRQSRQQLPNRGFHWFLLKQTANNFLKHPLNPIPVFKK
ncbi:MAG: hypothetical protein QM731_02185 [Chitinophagaceae bacterium]